MVSVRAAAARDVQDLAVPAGSTRARKKRYSRF